MPKSKRNKIVSTSRATRKDMQTKHNLVDKIQACCDEYASLYVFSVENMRNGKIKAVRQSWLTSRFFFGKNRIMRVALGEDDSSEYKPNLHKISKKLIGNVGLFFTNKDEDYVTKWFSSFIEDDFARA